MRGTTLCALLVVSVGCTRPNVGAGEPPPGTSGDGDQGGTTPVPPSGGGSSSNGGSGGIGGGGATGGGSAGGGGSGGMPAPCYSESLDLAASIDDLQMAFQSGWNGNWLQTALAVLDRRTPGGHTLLDTQKGDPNLTSYVDPTDFASLIRSLDGMCGSESSSFDWSHASNDRFGYWMPPSLTVTPERIATFPINEIVPLLVDDSTAQFDGMYLYDQAGQSGMVTLAEELNAHTNGLACLAAAGDQVQPAVTSRDAVAAQLYYLELYLHQARTAHADIYTTLQGSADWQKLVRYEWARAHFWYGVALMFPSAGTNDARIWAHVHDPNNLMEISLFTGQDPSYVACNP